MKPTRIKLRPRPAKPLCCRIYATRGLRCPECNPPRPKEREQHND